MRVRFRFTKLGKVRFISHRDTARAWERALRRAELPVARTEGFNPRPKVHFGLALPTGAESRAEYLDVDLRDDEPGVGLDADVDDLVPRLSALLPEGIEVATAAVVDTATPSLQQAVTSCTWTIEVPGLDPSAAPGAVARLLAADELPVTRHRKGRPVRDDIRPYLLDLAVAGEVPALAGVDGITVLAPAGTRLVAELGTQPRALRPSELVAALGAGLVEGHLCRNEQWTTIEGARREPLPAAPTPVGAP